MRTQLYYLDAVETSIDTIRSWNEVRLNGDAIRLKVNGPSAAHTAATAAASAAAEIHGLGRGGNVPHQPQPSGTRPGSSRPDSAREGDGGRGRGRGRGR